MTWRSQENDMNLSMETNFRGLQGVSIVSLLKKLQCLFNSSEIKIPTPYHTLTVPAQPGSYVTIVTKE